MAGDLELGSVVELKSGSPALNVRSIDGEDIKVEWFDKNVVRNHVFKSYQLKKFTGPKQTVIFASDLDYNPMLGEPLKPMLDEDH